MSQRNQRSIGWYLLPNMLGWNSNMMRYIENYVYGKMSKMFLKRPCINVEIKKNREAYGLVFYTTPLGNGMITRSKIAAQPFLKKSTSTKKRVEAWWIYPCKFGTVHFVASVWCLHIMSGVFSLSVICSTWYNTYIRDSLFLCRLLSHFLHKFERDRQQIISALSTDYMNVSG